MRPAVKTAGILDTTENCWDFFIEQVSWPPPLLCAHYHAAGRGDRESADISQQISIPDLAQFPLLSPIPQLAKMLHMRCTAAHLRGQP